MPILPITYSVSHIIFISSFHLYIIRNCPLIFQDLLRVSVGGCAAGILSPLEGVDNREKKFPKLPDVVIMVIFIFSEVIMRPPNFRNEKQRTVFWFKI